MSDEPKRLFEIEATVKIYVAADDYTEAYEVARDAVTSGDVDIQDSDLDAYEITEAGEIETEWRDCVPFGGELNCLEHLTERERYEAERPRTREELEAAGQQSLLTPNAGA